MNEPVTKELVIHKIKHNPTPSAYRHKMDYFFYSVRSSHRYGGNCLLLWHDMGHRYKNCLSMAHLLSSAGWNHDYTALSSSP